MIVYGTKASTLKNGQIINVDCPNCNANTSMKYSVFGKYAHLYWIPLFPFEKITAAECNSCKKTYLYKDLPQNIKIKLDREKEKHGSKIPVWMFSGLFLILGGIAYGFYSSDKSDREAVEYIKNPKAGDVYSYVISQSRYTAIRVDKVVKDSVYLTDNDYETDQTTGIEEIDVPKNYTINKEVLTKEGIQKMFKDKLIFEINRR